MTLQNVIVAFTEGLVIIIFIQLLFYSSQGIAHKGKLQYAYFINASCIESLWMILKTYWAMVKMYFYLTNNVAT